MVYHPAHDAYFENQVLTATPQKLRWMAIDGAIRFARQAAEHWKGERFYAGGEALIDCQRLLLELISAVKPERAPELAGNVSSLYVYISRLLNDALRARDQEKLGEMIELLEIERETWRQVCEQLGAAPQAPTAAVDVAGTDSRTAQGSPSPTPHSAARRHPGLGAPRFDLAPPTSGFTASA